MLLLGLLWQLGRRRANRLSKIPAGMGCVCVCMGVVSGLRAKLWLVAAPSARQKVAGGAVMGLQAFGSPCPGSFFFFFG